MIAWRRSAVMTSFMINSSRSPVTQFGASATSPSVAADSSPQFRAIDRLEQDRQRALRALGRLLAQRQRSQRAREWVGRIEFGQPGRIALGATR